MSRLILHNAVLATMANNGVPYGLMPAAAIALEHGKIAWQGDDADIPEQFNDWPRQDLGGRLVTPALIDCHTHIVYAGDRAKEFELRLNGVSYAEIAQQGGGILSTVNATREASEEQLLALSLVRVDDLLAEGVAGIEIKSGYGLDQQTELKMLRVARRIEALRQVRVRTTFLGAHTLPAEYSDRADEYLDQVCLPALEAAYNAGLVDAVDGFCETIAFSPAQITRVFEKAQSLGLPVKLHAEQLSNQGGAGLAARYDALSADHLEHLDEQGIAAMAKSGSVAVMLPGAFYYLRETRLPPIEHLRAAGVPLAVATDCNPGSSPLTSLLLAMNMASTLFAMTPEEALRGVTCNAARALGLQDCGVIEVGMRADLAVWNTDNPAQLAYSIGQNPLHSRIFEGVIC